MKMSEIKYYIDDRFEVPEQIKQMSHEDRQKEIARLEAEAAEKKNAATKKQMPRAV